MPIPDFVLALRDRVGHDPLWLSGATGVVLRAVPDPAAPDGRARSSTTEVLLVRRSDTGGYALVSGIVDPGEHPADTIVREAQEETLVEIVVERLIDIGVVGPVTYPNGDVTSYIDHAFSCRWVSGEAGVGDDEATEVGWWPLGALPELSAEHARLVDMAASGRVGAHLGPA